MRTRALKFLSVSMMAGALFFAGACSINLTQPSMEIQRYQLDYESPLTGIEPVIDAVMRIRRFSTSPVYDRPEMIFSRGRFERGVDFYSQWATRPGDMIPALLMRDIQASGLFRAVTNNLSGLLPDYELEGVVMEFLDADKNGKERAALLSAQVTVTRVNPGKGENAILIQKTYAASSPFTERRPQAFVAAMSAAMKTLSGELIKDIQNAIPRSGRRGN